VTLSHHVLRVPLHVGHTAVRLSHHSVELLETLVGDPIIVLVWVLLHEVLLLIIINSVLVLLISLNLFLILSGLTIYLLNMLTWLKLLLFRLVWRHTSNPLTNHVRLIQLRTIRLLQLLTVRLYFIWRHPLWRANLRILKVLSKLYL
jgi:hypothetical protein